MNIIGTLTPKVTPGLLAPPPPPATPSLHTHPTPPPPPPETIIKNATIMGFECVSEVVFGWRNTRRAVINYESGFSSFVMNFRPSSLIHSSNRLHFIQLFGCDLYLQGSCLMLLKHQGLFYLLITDIGI